MSATAKLLTLDDFRSRYTDENKPYFEYWHGEAVQKSAPTWLHSLLQTILVEAFKAAGYKAAVELELRISPHFQPKPDIAAALMIEQPYPTKPIEIVAEVLSPEDSIGRVNSKCRAYQAIGIKQIFVFDPQQRTARLWNPALDDLDHIEELQLTNGVSIPAAQIWTALDRELA